MWTCTCQEGQRQNNLEFIKWITQYTTLLSCTSKNTDWSGLFLSLTELAHSHRVAIFVCFSVCPRRRETHSSGGCGDFCMKDLLLKLGCDDTILVLMFFVLSLFLGFWSQPTVCHPNVSHSCYCPSCATALALLLPLSPAADLAKLLLLPQKNCLRFFCTICSDQKIYWFPYPGFKKYN